MSEVDIFKDSQTHHAITGDTIIDIVANYGPTANTIPLTGRSLSILVNEPVIGTRHEMAARNRSSLGLRTIR